MSIKHVKDVATCVFLAEIDVVVVSVHLLSETHENRLEVTCQFITADCYKA